MRHGRRRRFWLLAPILVVALVGTALTAANVIASSRAGITNTGVTANDLKPLACAALNLTAVRGPAPGGGNASQLIIGTAAGETLQGNGGDDCILGAGGNDVIRGNGGNDVCIGGAGTDTFHSTCETQIQ